MHWIKRFLFSQPYLFIKFVQKENENSLREAILLSKLEFDEQKKELPPPPAKDKKKKKDKPVTISLEQFHSLDSKEVSLAVLL